MTPQKTVLIADDDYDNFLLTMDAMKQAGLDCELYWVRDGEELLDYLRRRGAYQSAQAAPRPNVILLDLNMPKKTGHEALEEIRSEPSLSEIPVIVLTVSNRQEDIRRSLKLGAQSFISKPSSFEVLVDFMKVLKKYL